MSITHTITKSWARSNATISVAMPITDGDENNLDLDAVANGTHNQKAVFNLTLSKVKSIYIESSQNATLKAGGTNEVQRLTITGSPDGGNFTMTYSGQTTASIAFNASASAVQSALRALSNITVDGVVCTGGPLPGSTVDIEFTGALSVTDVAAMTTTDSLTGGSSPATAITTPTPGVAADTTITLVGGYPLDWQAAAGYYNNPFAADIAMLRFTNVSGSASNLNIRTLSTT